MLVYGSRVADTQHPGLAKFGIALEWGSRGRWFESSNSDQKTETVITLFRSFTLYEWI